MELADGGLIGRNLIFWNYYNIVMNFSIIYAQVSIQHILRISRIIFFLNLKGKIERIDNKFIY